jgi:glycosyltransferase involved in cell wall biosynthesis
LGFVPYAELPRLYRQARVLVNPALSEAFGMSLVEAMANRVAVVASRVGGMLEVVQHGQTGLLVEAENPQALCQAMLSLLQNPDRAREMATRGRQRAERLFDWDRIAEQTWSLYQDLRAKGSA